MDLDERAGRLDDALATRGLAAVWFARPNGFAWLTGGRNVVDRDADLGVAAAGYDGSFRAITNNIEAGRLADEELPDRFDVESFPWHETTLPAAVAERSPAPAAADFDAPGLEPIDPVAIRQPLSAADVGAYRRLGRDVAAAVERVCLELAPGDTESETAVAVRTALERRGIAAPVVLVGGGDRAPRYRHYTPSDTEVGAYALVSVTAERGGLYASCTRTAAFDPPEWLRARHRAAARVEATAIAATRAVADGGGTAGEAFRAIRAAYEGVGWDDEWRNHHQGGAAGFDGREWIATPDGDEPVTAPMAYAWNPTVAGAKSEDTVLVDGPGGDHVRGGGLAGDGRAEALTRTGEWPTLEVEPVAGAVPGVADVATFERHAPLYRP